MAKGRRVLFEGAHGTMLDIDHGTYPFVTSSSCLASAVFAGAGLAPGSLEAVLGISKAYTTRVGGGSFPTEIKGSSVTACVPRRRVRQRNRASAPYRMVRRGARSPGRASQRRLGLAVTKLDILTGIDPLKICIAYENRGNRYDEMPPCRVVLDKVRPVCEDLPGWSQSLQGVQSMDDLPRPARRYLERISALTGVPLAIIGTGAAREATIMVSNPFLS